MVVGPAPPTIPHAVCPVSPTMPGLQCPRIPLLTVHTPLPCGPASTTLLLNASNINGSTPPIPVATGTTTMVPAIQTVLPYYSTSPLQNAVHHHHHPASYSSEKLSCTQVVSSTPYSPLPLLTNHQFLSALPQPASPPGSEYGSPPTAVLAAGTTPVCQLSPNVLTVPSWKQSYGMEQVWQREFKMLFSQYAPHIWLLLPVNQKPPSGVWNTTVDSAKVRFCCEDCGHGWTSMKGRVGFWFILNPLMGEGTVCLKLYGQQCDRCKTGTYEPAMWYPEEVAKVLVNIYNKVGQVYYGFQQAPYHKNRRPGKPRTPHNSELCQACKDGVCSERR